MNNSNLQELAYELSIMHQALLVCAGINKDKLDKAIEVYINCIDELPENDDLDEIDEILFIVGIMRDKHKYLFEK